MNEISLSVYRGKSDIPMLKCILSTIITEVFVRTFDMEVGLALANIEIDYRRHSTGEIVKMLRRHQETEDDIRGVLLRLDYKSAQSNAPDFESTYGKTLQRLGADFVGLDVVLDREGLVELKQFATGFQEELAAVMPEKEAPIVAAIDQPDIRNQGQEGQTSVQVTSKSTGKLENVAMGR